MHTIEIPEANYKKHIPSHLGECTSNEYINMCELMFRQLIGNISYTELRVHAIYKLMNIIPNDEDNDEIENPHQKVAGETKIYANIYMLSELIDEFFTIDENNQKAIRLEYINNPIQKYKPIFKAYYGPSNSFENIKFGEYTDALRLFYEFETSRNVELLYHLAAILYREKKAFHFIKKKRNNYDGDIREYYNPNKVNDRAKKFKKFPIGFVFGVYLLFASFQKFISTAEISWAGRKLNLSILFTTELTEPVIDIGKDDVGMDAIMFTMAESGVFGSPKELNQTSLWMVFVRMYDTRLNDLKLKKQEENANNKLT